MSDVHLDVLLNKAKAFRGIINSYESSLHKINADTSNSWLDLLLKELEEYYTLYKNAILDVMVADSEKQANYVSVLDSNNYLS